ncbi:hypothetical protein EZS27_019876 [termite gut metagenome]|uniref:Uncharacterized protein n=1 Tax=termite gut metagenome TaxID=433724 RepID=A0A5J4RBZ1_9ZZZZ
MKSSSIIKTFVFLAFSIIFTGASAQTGGIFEGSEDVGNPKLKGHFSYDPSTKAYTLSGGGVNIWFANDQFFYAWKKVTGNFSLTAKVDFEGKGVDAHRKTGIMIRESLADESKYADVVIHGDGLTSLQHRPGTGQQTLEVVGPRNGNYITLERVGSKIRMRTATDTFPQEATGEIELEFPRSFYVGFFICSHDTDVLETVYFTNVEYKKL